MWIIHDCRSKSVPGGFNSAHSISFTVNYSDNSRLISFGLWVEFRLAVTEGTGNAPIERIMWTYFMSIINLLRDGLKLKDRTAFDFLAVRQVLRIYETMDKVKKKAEKQVHRLKGTDKILVATWSEDLIHRA